MEINKISSEAQKSMKTRIITAIIIGLVMIPCIILGDWPFVILVSFLSIAAIYESLHITGKKYPWYIYLIMYIFTFSFIFWIFKSDLAYYENNHFYIKDIRISTMGVAFMLAILFTISVFNEKIDTKDVFYLFTMSLFLGISMQSVLFLRFSPGAFDVENKYFSNSFITCLLFVYVILGTCLNDIFAYFVGVLLGKHKMNPRVSPKKTWEGFIGGIVLSSLFTMIFAIICEKCFNIPLIPGNLDLAHWYNILFASLLISFSAVLGDLMFSLIKRSYNIKDYGNIFPGHGGVLDRFDSLLITSLLAAIFVAFIVYAPFSGVIM